MRGGVGPYFLLFATDADREIKIPICDAGSYRTLHEGWPAQLRKCKVMIRAFDRTHWFLVTTRHSGCGAKNHSIYETMGFAWNGPLMVARLERRGESIATGILSSEHHQAAIAAVERSVILLTRGTTLTSGFQLPRYYASGDGQFRRREVVDVNRR